ncbi:MAG TPA: TspO/MBR family protein [Candidatus Paceibacterota bacterium]
MGSIARAFIAVITSYSAGVVGYLFISTGAGSWYDTLTKPDFLPPSWVFAPVWLVLYGLMAAALYIVWTKDPYARDFTGWVPMFFAHLLLNAAWPIFFFGFHAIFIAFIDISVLAFSIVLLICGAWQVDKRATFLLAPYLGWVLFATLLNGAIWYLN